jgi:acid phosphatase (class A)
MALNEARSIAARSSVRRGARRHRLIARLAVIALFATPVAPAVGASTAPPDRYLFDQSDLGALGFVLPPPPPAPPKVPDPTTVDLDILRSSADLDQVRAAQLADGPAKAEAFEDADSYYYDTLLPRFSVAAGRRLTITRRPILAHMLNWLLADVDKYKIKEAKGPDGTQYNRLRPFVVDPSIVPCNQSYMKFPALPNESDSSYPSGHAAHGYIAGLLLGLVMPDRDAPILARGVLFGTNRVVCGVHFPSDVLMGQAYARFIFNKARATDLFKKDLACAIEEDSLDRIGNLPKRKPGKTGKIPTSPFSPDCQKRDAEYYTLAST